MGMKVVVEVVEWEDYASLGSKERMNYIAAVEVAAVAEVPMNTVCLRDKYFRVELDCRSSQSEKCY